MAPVLSGPEAEEKVSATLRRFPAEYRRSAPLSRGYNARNDALIPETRSGDAQECDLSHIGPDLALLRLDLCHDRRRSLPVLVYGRRAGHRSLLSGRAKSRDYTLPSSGSSRKTARRDLPCPGSPRAG